MLDRVLEPEVMDSPEEALDYDAMDHAEVNRRFVDDFLSAGGAAGEVLDLGTGTAQIPIELCARGEDVRVVAVDLAASMLDVAKASVEVENLTGRIMLDRVDAKSLPYEDDRFAAVMSNSIVHHVPDPAAVFSEAVRVTAAGGLVFFRDLVRPKNEDAVRRLVATYAGNESRHGREMFEASLRAALTVEEVRELVEPMGAGRDSVEMTSDRHWTWAWRKPETPDE